jgi:hypothetical protein
MWRTLLLSARRSSTMVLSSSTSFSTSESPELPKELLDWLDRLRCKRAPVRGRSLRVSRLDELLVSLAWYPKGLERDGVDAVAF